MRSASGVRSAPAVDILSSLTGSRVRADLLAALFGSTARTWKIMELERLTKRDHGPLRRELQRLADVGLLRAKTVDGHREYEAERDAPVAREISRLVGQTRGRIPRIRRALVQLRTRPVAWIVGPPPLPAGDPRAGRRLLVVVSASPRSLVRVQLASLCPDMELHAMSIEEWVTRLAKGDVLLRHARRARKLWVLGSWDDLTAREGLHLDAKRIRRAAVANWQDELSDDWDDTWDPLQAFGSSRR